MRLVKRQGEAEREKEGRERRGEGKREEGALFAVGTHRSILECEGTIP